MAKKQKKSNLSATDRKSQSEKFKDMIGELDRNPDEKKSNEARKIDRKDQSAKS